MTTEQTERLLRCAFLDEALSEEDRVFFGFYLFEASNRDQALRLIALLITPEAKVDYDELALELIRSIWAANNHVLHGSIVDKLYPKPVLDYLTNGKFINRTLSGYALLPKGVSALRANEQAHA